MSQADDLLATLSVDYTDEAYIYVNDDRTITVPDELKHIAVEHDHNIETVIIDCPRYWDGHDFSKMTPYINYMRPDGYKDSYRAKNLRVSDEDDTRILFDWTISANVTQIKGNLSFLVYIEDPDANPCWHSRLNQQMIIDEGLSCKVQIEMAPDSIEEVLARTTASYIEKAKAEIEGKTAQVLASIPEDYITVNNMAEEALREKSNAIKMEAEGEAITVHDSADNAMLGLKLYGKTTQVSTTGRNLWDNASAYLPFSQTTLTDTGFVFHRGGATGGMYVSCNIPIVAGTTYTFSCKGNAYTPSLAIYKDAVYGTQLKSGTGSITYTAVSSTSTAVFAVIINSKDSSCNFSDIQVEIGNSVTEYEPYSGGIVSPSPEWPQSLHDAGGNGEVVTWLHNNNLANLEDATLTRCELIDKTDGSVRLNVTNLYYGEIYLYDLNEYILANQGKTLIFGVDSNPDDMQLNIVIYGTRKSDYYGTASYQESNGKSGVSQVSITPINFSAVTAVVLRLGRKATAYTDKTTVFTGVRLTPKYGTAFERPAKLQTVKGLTPDGLRGVPVSSGGNYIDSNGQQWICDEIDFERGVYVKRVGLSSMESDPYIEYIYSEKMGSAQLIVAPDPLKNQAVYGTLCNVAMRNDDALNSVDGEYYENPANIVFVGSASDDETSIRQKYSAFELLYALETPIETPLTDAELASFKMVRSNYPSTTVLNDSGAYMSIKYAADTKSYVDNSLGNGTLVDTATGQLYRLVVTNGQLTVVAV